MTVEIALGSGDGAEGLKNLYHRQLRRCLRKNRFSAGSAVWLRKAAAHSLRPSEMTICNVTLSFKSCPIVRPRRLVHDREWLDGGPDRPLYRRRTVGPREIKTSASRLERLLPPCMGRVCQVGKAPLTFAR